MEEHNPASKKICYNNNAMLSDNINIKKTLSSYALLFLFLTGLSFGPIPELYFKHFSHDFIAGIEMISALLAFGASYSAILFYYINKNRYYLLICTGFFICGFQQIVNSLHMISIIPHNPIFDPSIQSLFYIEMGHFILALTLLGSYVIEPYPTNRKKKNINVIVYLSIAALIMFGMDGLLIKIPFTYTVLRYAGAHRPISCLSSVLLFISFILITRKLLKKGYFTAWFLSGILCLAYSDLIIFISASEDPRITIINLAMRLIGYACPVIGILIQFLKEKKKVHVVIRQRQQAEMAKWESEEKYNDLIDLANSIILRMDAKGRILFFNNYALEFFGFKKSEIYGKSVIGTIVPKTDRSGRDLEKMIHDIILNTEKYKQNENENITHDGTHVWISWTNKPIVKNNKLIEILCIGNDHSKQKLAQAELERAYQEMENRVQIRTAELTETNIQLQEEIKERKRAEASLSTYARQLAVLNEISRKISSTLNINDLMDSLPQMIFDDLGYPHVNLFTLDKTKSQIMLRSHYGEFSDNFPQDYHQQKSAGIVGWVFKNNKTFLSNNTENEPIFVTPITVKAKSELCVPINLNNEVIGIIDLQSPKRDSFDAYDVMIIETLASQMAVAIENARLFESSQKELENRIKTENALRESEGRFRSVVEQGYTGIAVIDEVFRFSYVNQQLCNISGYSHEELINQDFRSYIDIKDVSVISGHYLSRQQGLDAPQNYECTLIRKDHETRIIEICASVIRTSNDQMSTIAHILDITPRKRMEESLRLHTQELENLVNQRTNELIQSEKMASLGQLVAGVAHEVNNPLSYIKSNSHFIKEDIEKIRLVFLKYHLNTELIDQLETLAQTNIEGINRIAKITQTLKRFSRPDIHERQESDINQGLRDTLLMVHSQLKHRITVIEEYGDIPKIRCNIGQLNQVFMNLIINASQAMEKGTIIIKTHTKNHAVFIEIQDNGKGIPKENLNKIFDPFFTTRDQGTGLGLSICYRIIKDHSGQIHATSLIDKGTTMTIQLPITD